MTRERRFALVVIMATAGMNALITATLVGLALLGPRPFDVTDLSLLVFSIGCFVLAHDAYKLRVNESLYRDQTVALQARLIETRLQLTAARATAQAVVRLAKAAGLEVPRRVDESRTAEERVDD